MIENIIFIDFSVNSTAICLYKVKEKSYKYFSIINRNHFTKSLKTDVMKTSVLSKLIGSDVSFFVNDRKPNSRPKGNPTAYCKKNLINNRALISQFESVVREISKEININTTIIGIEDYAISIKSSNVTEIAELTSLYKNELFKVFDVEKSYFFQPQEIKKITGNGNATKEMMLMYTIKRNIKHPLHKIYATNYKDFLSTSGKVKKPIEDLVDSFCGVELMRGLLGV